MDIYDENGDLKGSVGVQPDGGVALVAVNTPPPPTPTPPAVEPVLAGLIVGWDGQWDDSYTTPTDFSLVQVHIGPSPDFLPELGTHVATITAPLGGTVTIAVDGYTAVWVRLVATNTATTTGPASAAVQGTPRQAVEQDLIDGIVTETKLARDAVTETKIALGAVGTAALAAGAVLEDKLAKAAVTLDKIAQGAVTTTALATDAVTAGKIAADAIGAREIQAGSVTTAELAAGSVTTDKLTVAGGLNQLSDPSFEGAYTGLLVASQTYWSQVTGGNGSSYALKLDCASATAVSRNLRLTTVPVLAGDQLYLGVDYNVSSDWVGRDVRFFARWYDGAGTHLSTSALTQVPSGRASWERVTGTVSAAVGAVQAQLYVEGNQCTVGAILFDNAVVRPLVPGVQIADGAITAPKILAGAVTTSALNALAVTAEKIAALAITTDKLAALAVTADKLAANSVTATKILAGTIDATHIKVGSLTADRLALGTDGNVIADGSFEGAITDQRVAAATNWSITTGNNTPRAVQVDATNAVAATRALTLADLPAVPGQKMWLGTDYLASADWVGSRISIYAEWLGADGSSIGTSVVTTGDGAAIRGTWQRITGVPAEPAPTNTTRVRIRIACVAGTAGAVAFDNTAARVVVSSGAAGARAEISPQGLQLFDDAGDEAIALMTGRPNYLSLSNGGVAVATIDETGNAGFGDLAVAGKLTIGGDPIEDHLTLGARGLVALDYQAMAVSASTTDYGFVELAFEAEGPRMYRVVLDCYADPSVAGGEVVLTLRDGGASTPTISSPQIQSAVYPVAGAGFHRVRLETIRSGWAFGVGLHRLLTTFRVQGGPAGQTVRLLGGTTLPGVFYIEDVGPYLPETGQYNTGGGTATPPLKQYTKTYPATWSGSYANRSSYNSYYGNKAMQGYYSATNGMQSSLIGFSSTLATDLAGTTINKAEIYLYFDHWYSNAGGKAVIKAHKHASRPSTFSCDSEAMTVSWGKNVGKWVDITAVFDSTSWRGIALDPNNSSTTYYGRARGYGETYPPQLRVTYTK
ncbi:hypothetical protein [Streptomyces sp. NRRL B-24572]|uniref:hypothetical protein n=1 Tax=Streptomyces sp. NRRL B-24572 TaxID=1962156 RepID=UPI0015C50570|nr:hypothetical protein [Streptomyces sp. NRRL B-24572]